MNLDRDVGVETDAGSRPSTTIGFTSGKVLPTAANPEPRFVLAKDSSGAARPDEVETIH